VISGPRCWFGEAKGVLGLGCGYKGLTVSSRSLAWIQVKGGGRAEPPGPPKARRLGDEPSPSPQRRWKAGGGGACRLRTRVSGVDSRGGFFFEKLFRVNYRVSKMNIGLDRVGSYVQGRQSYVINRVGLG